MVVEVEPAVEAWIMWMPRFSQIAKATVEAGTGQSSFDSPL
jgi:hypothetical protein